MFSKKLTYEQIWKVHDEFRANINSEIDEIIQDLQSKDIEIGGHWWKIQSRKREELEANRRTIDLFVQKLQTERVR